jgi:phosphoglycerate kinase
VPFTSPLLVVERREYGWLERRTVEDLMPEEVNGRRALVRVDFNVPLKEENGAHKVASDVRIRAALPTLDALRAHGTVIVLASHLGRPKGKREPSLSLAPVGERLEELLGRRVAFLAEPFDARSVKLVQAAQGDETFLLENLRFEPGETKNDPDLARRLAEYGEVFVQDAFGTCHRAHASTVGVTEYLDPCVAGRLVTGELAAFRQLLEEPERPFVAILGGAKIADKLDTVRGLAERCDRVCVGGGMANTFLAARGIEIGDSLVEQEMLGEARPLLDRLGDKLVLPRDAVVAKETRGGGERVVEIEAGIEPGWKILDVGPATIAAFDGVVKESRTVFWNGPLGVFESPPFDRGTRTLAERLAEATARGAYTVVGGGDSIAALEEAGLLERVSHASTGGGAALELVSGARLPGIEALDPAFRQHGGSGRGAER